MLRDLVVQEPEPPIVERAWIRTLGWWRATVAGPAPRILRPGILASGPVMPPFRPLPVDQTNDFGSKPSS